MRRNLLIIVIVMTAMTLLPGFTVTAGAKAKHTFKIEEATLSTTENPYRSTRARCTIRACPQPTGITVCA